MIGKIAIIGTSVAFPAVVVHYWRLYGPIPFSRKLYGDYNHFGDV